MAGAHAIAAKLQRALALHQQGQLGQAEALYREVLQVQPGQFDALHLLGVAVLQRGQARVALDLIGQALAINPTHAEALNNRGNALHQLGRHAEALASYEQALRLRPDHADALNNRGNVLQALGRHAEALVAYERSLALRPHHPQALRSRGNVLLALARYEDALGSFDRALSARPGYPEALTGRGHALQVLGRPEEALASYGRALALRPDDADALNSCGFVLQELRRHAEALANYDRALALKPDDADALNNRGNALQSLGREDEALASYERALRLRPDNAQALHNRGNILRGFQRLDEAVASYAEALGVRPDYPFLFGTWLRTRMKLCDWVGLDEAFARLGAAIDAGLPVASPFDAMATPLSRHQQRRCAELYVQQKFPGLAPGPGPAPRGPGERLRLGYFSADFREHPVAVLTAGLFEHHDRSRFELLAFALGPPSQAPLRTRMAAACDRFIEVGDRTDAEVAAQARALGLDIAVDLMGFTAHSRTGIFARRAAPVQVNYLGFPGTMGADYMDYLIADATVIPPGQAESYTEQIAYLPHSFQPNDAQRPIADRAFSRGELGLPAQGFVFCNFNNAYKLTPADFDVWMRLLQQVEGSVLWLAGAHPLAESNLRREAAARGVAGERLVFKARTAALAEHLAQLRQADLFLDCAYFNAHTTASDALWAGVPLLTRPGATYASRVAASLLTALGLPELIATSADAYEALALELAREPAKLAALRARLAAHRLTHPLFDTAGYTRHLEAAYTAMWQRHQAGLAPAAFRVPALRVTA